MRGQQTYLGIVADVVPPRRVEDVVTLHDLLEHLRLVVRVERLVAAQPATQSLRNANRKPREVCRTVTYIADDSHVYIYRSGSFALPLPLISKFLVCPDKARQM